MSDILDKVKCKLDDYDLIEIINFYKGKNISIENSVFEYFRSDVKEFEKEQQIEYQEFFLNYYYKCAEKLWDRDIKSKNKKKCSSVDELISSYEYKNLHYKPIFFVGKNSNYRTICIDGSYGMNTIKEKHDCRLYMCPKTENIIPIVKKIISVHNNLNLYCYLKINTNSKDNDRIVIYSSLEHANKHLEIIKKIQMENKDLFDSMKKNKLWGEIDGIENVYFGMNPFLSNHGSSYLAIRSAIIESALLDLKNKYPELDNCDNVTSEILDFFKEMIRVHSIAHNVNPDNMCLNINNYKKRGKSPIVLKKGFEEIPIVVNYIIPEEKKAIISSPLYVKDSNNFLMVSIDDLEQLYNNDETTIKYILKKVELLHTKSKIMSGFSLKKTRHINITNVNSDVVTYDGNISYGLYKSIPSIISSYMCLSFSRFDQHKRGTVDIETIEKLSRKTDDIFDINPHIIGKSKNIIIEAKKSKEEKNYNKKLVLTTKK